MMDEYVLKTAALEIVRRTSGDYAAAFSAIRALPAASVVQIGDCKGCIPGTRSVPAAGGTSTSRTTTRRPEYET